MERFVDAGWIARVLAILGVAVAVGVGVVAPFLPGAYDPLSVSFSTTLQALGLAGVVLAPLAAGWLVHEVVVSRRLRRGLAAKSRGRDLRIGTLVGIAALLVLVGAGGLLAGSVVTALLAAMALIGTVAMLCRPPGPVPWLAVVVLVITGSSLAGQLVAVHFVDGARETAIIASGGLIADIEAYANANGRYPESLQAVWHDYSTGLIGTAPVEYARTASGYQIAFEQPHPLIDDFGAREMVVYSSSGAATMISHDSWILLFPASQLVESPGWFARALLDTPGWSSFRFD
ncbi:MAG: hypothetical protein KIT69_04450 [Propionibacteriaceae bacterium]|nr:hypothetical protein [Actinomycetota bacterium]MCW5951486.1 hypothetical protein [Propionibacteriaceae bacterium]